MAGPGAGLARRRLRVVGLSREENVLAVLSTVTAVLPVSLTGAVGVALRHQLGLSLAEFGLGISVYYGSSACFSAALGPVAQRLGPRDAVRLGLGFAALSMLGLGSVAASMPGFLLCLLLAGVCNAIVHPAVNHFLTLRMEPGRLASAVGAKQAAVPLAILLAGVSVPVLALNLGWRSVYLVGAGAALALVAVWTLHRAGRAALAGPSRRGRISSARRTLVAMGVAGGLAAMGGNAIGVFLVSSAVAIDFSPGAAALLLAAGGAACALVRVTAGVVVDRRGNGGMRPFALLLAVGSLGFLGLTTQAAPAFAAAAIVAFGAGWGWPGLFQFSVIEANPAAAAAATGITQTGVYLGAASGPLLFGLLATSSYALAWTAISVVSLAASTVGALIARAR